MLHPESERVGRPGRVGVDAGRLRDQLDNLGCYPEADAFIVRSSIKREGPWSNPIDVERARALVRAFRGL